MRKLLIISMLVLGIAGESFCQKSKTDTTVIFEGIQPPILSNADNRVGMYKSHTEVKRNSNHIIINFGKKNLLKIDYQGIKAFVLKQNVDSLLADFWNDYKLIRDTINKDMVKKITYFGKNKNMNSKAIIDVQYYPQKEVFQFGKEVELVRLKQDTLLLVNYNLETNINSSSNWAVKTFKNQSFLFNLNTIDDVEEIIEFNINQAIIEATERAEIERKNAYAWKSVNVENDLMNQKIRNKIKGGALFDYINVHGDIGIGITKGQFQGSTTFTSELTSSKYLNKGILLGIQTNTVYKDQQAQRKLFFFTGLVFYSNNRNVNLKSSKGGLFLGVRPFNSILDSEKAIQTKVFGWYQLTPLIKVQTDFFSMNFSKKIIEFSEYFNLRLAFGF